MRKSTNRSRPAAYLAAAAVIVPVIVLLSLVPAVTARAVVPVLLLTVLVSARQCGTGPGVLASLLAALGYHYMFLPLTNLGPEEEWVALASFTSAAVIAGELAARAERRRVEALAGREEIERLYRQLRVAFEAASDVEAARRSHQTKAALLDALRHNLGTPLTAIKVSVTALLTERYGQEGLALSPESQRELLQVIDEEVDRLVRLSRNLSQAENVSDAPRGVPPAPVSAIVEQALTRAAALTRPHRVILELDETLPPLAVDEDAVSEVLYMLIDNATKYAPVGSALRIRASREGRSHAYLQVVDEGPGIPAHLREAVFERFFHVGGRDPHDPSRKGLGLGLSIVRSLVEAQGGRVWIETPLGGKGTAAILMLPLKVDQSSEKSTPAFVGS